MPWSRCLPGYHKSTALYQIFCNWSKECCDSHDHFDEVLWGICQPVLAYKSTIYRREVTQAIEVYGEFHRFLPALAHCAGFRVGEMPVRHRERRFGRSKFGAARFVNGFLDLMSAAFISTSALKPLHVFGRIGLGFLAIGLLIGTWFLAQWLHGDPMRVRPLMLFGVGLVLLGIQFILMGLLGEMIANMRARTEYPLKGGWNLEDGA